MGMLDFWLRRGNPTNSWVREPNLQLVADLSIPSLNRVEPGQPFDALAFLGRDEDAAAARYDSFRYYSLGVEVERAAADGSLVGFSLVADEAESGYQPYAGVVTWHGSPVQLRRLQQDALQRTFGDWYWLDADDDEAIVFYEFKPYEMQIECDRSGRVTRVIVTADALMASAEQRAAYGVTRPFPF